MESWSRDPVLTSDWLSGAGGEGEHLLGAAHREEEGEAVRQRAAQVSGLRVCDSQHNIWGVFKDSYVLLTSRGLPRIYRIS